ncbi:hypothetical protein MSG28_006255 [Choristoneura fumiferana]|uniref:Uncharacterized protein n=1 Tax=Choristoneura fumiferana TaxID=7141 RepID=A0ACC0JEE9_CHOFU|nr:hypothetical protein MSG28_006255 [Choristoneura fumiferana]
MYKDNAKNKGEILNLYPSHCWAQAAFENKRAIVPTRAQCGLGTSHAPLNCFAGNEVMSLTKR